MKEASSLPLSKNEKQEPQASFTASSLSSILSSPLATFTNFIPLSWSPRACQPGAAAAALRLLPDSSNRSSNATFDDQDNKGTRGGIGIEKKKYVSKENQLEKLRSRLAKEMRGPVDICRSCGDEGVLMWTWFVWTCMPWTILSCGLFLRPSLVFHSSLITYSQFTHTFSLFIYGGLRLLVGSVLITTYACSGPFIFWSTFCFVFIHVLCDTYICQFIFFTACSRSHVQLCYSDPSVLSTQCLPVYNLEFLVLCHVRKTGASGFRRTRYQCLSRWREAFYWANTRAVRSSEQRYSPIAAVISRVRRVRIWFCCCYIWEIALIWAKMILFAAHRTFDTLRVANSCNWRRNSG